MAEATGGGADDQNCTAPDQMADGVHSDVDTDETDARCHDRIFKGFGHTALLQKVGLVGDQEPDSGSTLATDHAIAKKGPAEVGT